MIARKIYSLVLSIVSWLLPLAAVFLPRVAKWLKGRSLQRIPARKPGQELVWIHCSSLGEFEQGRPVLEAVRKAYPRVFVALTFFSPSGYDRQKNFHAADWVGYLPLDTCSAAKSFIEELDPSLVLWVKYDFWFNHLALLRSRSVPSLLFAANFRDGSWMGKTWAKPFRELILSFGQIAVQDLHSAACLSRWGRADAVVAGDPRVDRVISLPTEPLEDIVLNRFAGGDPVIVCGSVWEADVRLLAAAMRHPLLADWKWLLAPHDLDPKRIQIMEEMIGGKALRYTRADSSASSHRVMILDTIGMLNRAYRLGRISYVGGGLGKSVHNLLEPAVYGIPVIFGPRHRKFPEGEGLIAAGGGFEVHGEESLCSSLVALTQEDRRTDSGCRARDYVLNHAGATDAIMGIVRKLLPS